MAVQRDEKGRFVKGSEGLGVQVTYKLRLDAVMQEIARNLESELSALGGDAVAVARRLAPKKTGKTASTIRLERGEALRMKLKGDFPTAHLEFGTVKMAPRPHMLPAALMAKRRALSGIGRRGLV